MAGVSASIRVLIVDDDALVRAALAMMLDGAHGIAVVGQAADGDEARTPSHCTSQTWC